MQTVQNRKSNPLTHEQEHQLALARDTVLDHLSCYFRRPGEKTLHRRAILAIETAHGVADSRVRAALKCPISERELLAITTSELKQLSDSQLKRFSRWANNLIAEAASENAQFLHRGGEFVAKAKPAPKSKEALSQDLDDLTVPDFSKAYQIFEEHPEVEAAHRQALQRERDFTSYFFKLLQS